MSSKNAPQTGKSAAPDRAPSLFKSKRGFRGFFKDVAREMRHVTWPTPQETVRLSGVVLAVCAIVVLYLFLVANFSEMVFDILLRGGQSR